MAKSGRKRKRAEKSKTKLRQSIKLPKNLNETQTKITAKKIVVADQLKSKDSNTETKVTKKKIGIKDLISKLSHYSTSIKSEALDGLLELLKAYPDLCQSELCPLLMAICPLNTHIESKIRQNSRTIFQLILQNCRSETHIQPLSSMIVAHLCCALSHLDFNIQLDGLKFLDIILDLCSIVVTMNSQLILPNCLNQIGLKSKSSDKTNSKLTVLQWKTEVLQRVYKILMLVQQGSQKVVENGPTKNYSSDAFYMNLTIVQPQNSLTLKDITEHQNKSETTDFVHFQQELKSILFDCWIEAINQQDRQTGKQKISLIKEASVPTLSVIIELLLIIQDSHKEEKLMLGITKNFPFEMLPTAKKENNVDIEELNLNICILVLNTNGYEEMVTKYLSNFQVKSSARASQVATILLNMPTKENQELHPIIHQLATKFAHNENVANLMLALSSNENESNVNVWIESLPEIICSAKVTKSHLEAIRMLFKRRNEVMLSAFQNMIFSAPESLKQLGLLDQVWRVLAILKPSKIPEESLMSAIQKSNMNSSTKNYVCNLMLTSR